LNYGYHNFVYSWLDSFKNFPTFIDEEVLLPIIGIVAKVSRTNFDLIFGEGIGMRVGAKGLTFT